MTEFWEYVTPYLDGQPHHIDDLTKVILKENTDPELIKRLEHICLNLPNIKHIQGDRVFMIVDVDDDKDRSLSESIKTIGAQTPLYYRTDGVTIVDGRHRLAEMPNYPFVKVILPNCKTEKDAILADLAINFNRLSPKDKQRTEELRQKITYLAMKEGMTVKEIKEATGLGLSTCSKYVPHECKNQVRAQAGIASGKVRAAKASQQEPITITPIANSPSTETPITEKEVNANFDNFVLSVEQNPRVKSLVDDPKLSPEQIANEAKKIAEEAKRIKAQKATDRAQELIKDAERAIAKTERARDKVVAAGEEYPEGLMTAVFGYLGLKGNGKVAPEKAKAYASTVVAVMFQETIARNELDDVLRKADLWQ